MRRLRIVTAIAAAVLVAMTLGACGGGASTAVTTAAPARDDAAAVMAAAIHRLISRDHTFGQGSHRFSEYLVLDHTDPTAGAPDRRDRTAARDLTAAERAAITDVVAPFGPLRFIADADAWRTKDLDPKVEGSVILGVGEPRITGDTALVPVSLWCSGLCGTWMTYRLARSGGTWTVTGTEGATAIS